jgi:hypothetical protein
MRAAGAACRGTTRTPPPRCVSCSARSSRRRRRPTPTGSPSPSARPPAPRPGAPDQGQRLRRGQGCRGSREGRREAGRQAAAAGRGRRPRRGSLVAASKDLAKAKADLVVAQAALEPRPAQQAKAADEPPDRARGLGARRAAPPVTSVRSRADRVREQDLGRLARSAYQNSGAMGEWAIVLSHHPTSSPTGWRSCRASAAPQRGAGRPARGPGRPRERPGHHDGSPAAPRRPGGRRHGAARGGSKGDGEGCRAAVNAVVAAARLPSRRPEGGLEDSASTRCSLPTPAPSRPGSALRPSWPSSRTRRRAPARWCAPASVS